MLIFGALSPAEAEQALTTAIPYMEKASTLLFVFAVAHTFLVRRLSAYSRRFAAGSIGENFFHFLGEVEVVFGLWATMLMLIWVAFFGMNSFVTYLETVNFTEAAFVFVTMCLAATRPIMKFSENIMNKAAGVLPLPGALAHYATIMIIGPVLGSLITEPAAMTVTALLLRDSVFSAGTSLRLKYITLGLLFVNISIGGTLTNFAAPPIVMVARSWEWSTPFMLFSFGWKSFAAIVFNVVAVLIIFRKELVGLAQKQQEPAEQIPLWMTASHLVFIALTVIYSHHMSFFIPLFLLFLGWAKISKEYQDELHLEQALLVGFFLGGLVTLGKLQAWWLQPALEGLDAYFLFFGATVLTAVTDNAALAYLGTLVPTLDDLSKYMLISGAVAGGGLTVIANAPNPAGYGILSPFFGEDGINPLYLFLAALPFTLVAVGALLFF